MISELKTYDTIKNHDMPFCCDIMPMAVGRKKRMIWWPYPIYYGGSDAGQIFSVSFCFNFKILSNSANSQTNKFFLHIKLHVLTLCCLDQCKTCDVCARVDGSDFLDESFEPTFLHMTQWRIMICHSAVTSCLWQWDVRRELYGGPILSTMVDQTLDKYLV